MNEMLATPLTAPRVMSADGGSTYRLAVAEESPAVDAHDRIVAPTSETNDLRSGSEPSFASRWFWNDILFIAMLVMALAGVILQASVMYWVILIPIFGLISIAAGWSHFQTRSERAGLAFRVAAIWCALLISIYLLYGDGVEGVMNQNASSLAMMTLLALGTFVAGVQARVWQICGVGVVLFLAVPGVGWLDQSPLLLTAAAVVIIALGGAVWWFKQTSSSAVEAPSPSIAPLDDGSLRRS